MPPLFASNLMNVLFAKPLPKKQNIVPVCAASGSGSPARIARTLASAAHQAQHHHEQVDEVEVERQRAHHGLAASRSGVIAGSYIPLIRWVS